LLTNFKIKGDVNMKFKKVAALTLVLSLTVSSAITNVFAEQNNTHYIKIERVTPGGKGFF
jgi:hypothetical protein